MAQPGGKRWPKCPWRQHAAAALTCPVVRHPCVPACRSAAGHDAARHAQRAQADPAQVNGEGDGPQKLKTLDEPGKLQAPCSTVCVQPVCCLFKPRCFSSHCKQSHQQRHGGSCSKTSPSSMTVESAADPQAGRECTNEAVIAGAKGARSGEGAETSWA